jgi:hypothetical protein
MYDKLVEIVSNGFKEMKDHRKGAIKYSLRDSLMGAFAFY